MVDAQVTGPTQPTNDARAVATLVSAEPDRARALACAIGFLHNNWSTLRAEDTLSGEAIALIDAGTASAVSRMPPDQFDAILDTLKQWLGKVDGGIDHARALLAFVLKADECASRADARILELVSPRHVVPTHAGVVTLWFQRRPIFWQPGRQVPTALIRPTLAARLSTIRYGLTNTRDRIRFVTAPDSRDVARQFLEFTLPGRRLRVGLFSVRGFQASFEWTRSFVEPTYGRVQGVRATGLVNRQRLLRRLVYAYCGGRATLPTLDRGAYEARLRSIVAAACDPERGVELLVLPELGVDSDGRKLIQAELSRRAREGGRTPILTFSGTWHEDGWNVCHVLSANGDIVWSQRKGTRYTYTCRRANARETAATRVLIRGLPANFLDEHDEHISEDINSSDRMHALRTPIGTFSVAICSDIVPLSAEASFPQALALPVDWLIVPSYNPRDGEDVFLQRGRDAARGSAVFLNANSDCSLQTSKVARDLILRPLGLALTPFFALTRGAGRPPRRLASSRWLPNPLAKIGDAVAAFRAPLTAFVNTPWDHPIAFWLDSVPCAPSLLHSRHGRNAVAWTGVTDRSAWEGLVVDIQQLADRRGTQ